MPKEMARIRSLAIPPAYTDVWICPSPNGHIQATGRDARRRKQYRYHPKWREVRDETKFGRMLAFSEVLPRIRARVEQRSESPGLPGEKVLATVVRLAGIHLHQGGQRGVHQGEPLVRTHHPAGPPRRDLRPEPAFEFRGKSGKTHKVALNDRRLARIVQRCQALPGEDLFQYVDEDGVRQTIGSGDVNDYIREISGAGVHRQGFSHLGRNHPGRRGAHRGRRWATQKQAKSNVLRAIDRVAEQLNNTRAVCRKYYVHPAVFEAYLAGSMLEHLQNGKKPAAKEIKEITGTELSSEEKAVVRLIQRQLEAASAA